MPEPEEIVPVRLDGLMRIVEHLESRGLPLHLESFEGQTELTTDVEPGRRWVAVHLDESLVPRPVGPPPVARRRAGAVASVDVEETDEDGWHVSSDDLVARWGLEHGPEADDVVERLLAERAPHLAGAVELDSFEETFSAYTRSRAVADELAALLRESG